MVRRKTAKYPNIVYSTKASAERAKKRYGGKSLKKVDISLTHGRSLKGYGVRY